LNASTTKGDSGGQRNVLGMVGSCVLHSISAVPHWRARAVSALFQPAALRIMAEVSHSLGACAQPAPEAAARDKGQSVVLWRMMEFRETLGGHDRVSTCAVQLLLG